MELNKFLSLIWPSTGYYFVAHIDEFTTHKPFRDVFSAEDAIEAFDRRGGNTYFGLASYQQPEYIGKDGKKKRRTQENVARLKCVWVDLDCKGKGTDYASQGEAVADILRLCEQAGIALPTLTVNSGYGIHAYWVFDSELTRDAWVRIAAMWRATLDRHNVKHDSACTEDCARILRPITAHNRKVGADDREVEVISQNGIVNLAEFASRLLPAIPRSMPSPKVDAVGFELNKMAESVMEYPPSSFLEVVKNCSLMREIARVRGNVSEPLWYAALGLVKHTVEAAKAITAVSCGHPDYTEEAAAAKADQWSFGPPTCAKLESVAGELSGVCNSCPHRANTKSPIMLGHTHMPKVEVTMVEVAGIVTEKTEEIPAMPQGMQGFRWDGIKLQKSVLDEAATKQSGVETYAWVSFCSFFFYPHCYYRDENDSLVMVWKLREREGAWREFELSGEAMGAGGLGLFRELGSEGVVASHGKKPFMEAYVTGWYAEVKKATLGSETYMHFGWHGDSFLLGDTMFRPGGVQDTVRVGGDAQRMVPQFAPRGSVERWSELVEQAYNRPGHEQYQFLLGTGFGSPLIQLMGFSGGLTMSALSTGSGQGKTTACHMAMGIYGFGNSGSSTSLSISQQQATPKYVFAHAGILHNLPCVLDEITNIKPIDASETLYTFSGGTPRVGLRSDGRMSRTRLGWTSILLTSSNKPLVSIITAYKPGADAELARLLEFDFDSISTMSKEDADNAFRELYLNYGHVGRKYIAHVVDNHAEVREMLLKLQRSLDKRFGLNRKDRFWSVGVAATLGGLLIAKQLGLIKFDIEKIMSWIGSKVSTLRSDISVSTSDPSEMLGRMLSELSQGILVTDIMGGRGSGGKQAYIAREARGHVVGRAVIEEGRAYISQSVMAKWAVDNHSSLREIIAAAIDNGWLLDRDPVKMYLGRGTPVTAGQNRCYVFNWAAMENCAVSDPALGNVVSLMGRTQNS